MPATQSIAKVLTQGVQLTTSAVSQYLTPGNTATIVKKVTVTNSTGAAVTLTMYKVPSGGSVGASNIIVSAQSIPAGATYEVYAAENHVLMTGDSIFALASANTALTLHISGFEIS